MLLYDNAHPDIYEEIKTWYPVWYRDVLEMDALWRVWGGQLNKVRDGIILAIDNNFIDYADARTLGKLEVWLGIVYDIPRTISERRNVIKALLLGQGHIGRQEIKEMISVFTDGEIVVRLIGGTIQITITHDFGDDFNAPDCYFILSGKIPAHLALHLIDKALPISFTNSNRFILLDLATKIAIKNRTAVASGAILDGAHLLDGSWILTSAFPGLPFVDFGMLSNVQNTFRFAAALSMAIYRWRNSFSVSAVVGASLSATNVGALDLVSSTVTGLSAKQTYNLTGTVLMDGRWGLNGEHALNGAMRLNAFYEEKEL